MRIVLILIFLLVFSVSSVWAVEPVASTSVLGTILALLKSKIWKEVMEWLNLLVILWILWRYLCPFIFKTLDDGIRNIESRLQEGERRSQEIQERKAELNQKIAEIEQEKVLILQEAEKSCEIIRADIVQLTREQEIAIFAPLNKDVADYAGNCLNKLKDEFFQRLKAGLLSESYAKMLSGKSMSFSGHIIGKMGNFS